MDRARYIDLLIAAGWSDIRQSEIPADVRKLAEEGREIPEELRRVERKVFKRTEPRPEQRKPRAARPRGTYLMARTVRARRVG